MQVASTKPTMKAVAKTGGMSLKLPNSGETRGTVSPGTTVIVLLCRRPTAGGFSIHGPVPYLLKSTPVRLPPQTRTATRSPGAGS